MLHSRNGQMFSSDLVASVVIFFFIVNLSLIIWNIAYENQTAFDDERQLRERVVRSTDILVRTPGYPQDWDESTVKLAGFATEDHVLDNEKLRAFNDTAYPTQQEIVRAGEYQYYLNISVDGSTAVLQEPGEPDLPLVFGNTSSVDADTAVVNRRSILVNSSNGFERGSLMLVFWW